MNLQPNRVYLVNGREYLVSEGGTFLFSKEVFQRKDPLTVDAMPGDPHAVLLNAPWTNAPWLWNRNYPLTASPGVREWEEMLDPVIVDTGREMGLDYWTWPGDEAVSDATTE